MAPRDEVDGARAKLPAALRTISGQGAELLSSTTGKQASAAPREQSGLDISGSAEWLRFVSGCVFLCAVLPVVGAVVGGAVLWEAVDRGFAGGLVQSGRELSGFLCARVAPWVITRTQKFNEQFVKNSADAYMMCAVFLYGLCLPGLFCLVAHHHQREGLCWWVFAGYHLLRIGPYFMNFAYVYTLCHKEGHARAGLFRPGYNESLLRYVFNWWIGLFYGVLPSSFMYGHSVNHHRYNNGPGDVISTADMPRDSVAAWVSYVPRFFLYACNISTVVQFVREGDMRITRKMIWGTAWYLTWLGLWMLWSSSFALAYILYPLFEQTILLAVVNWSWHAFLDPEDPANEFVASLTILEGRINVLEEDYHVVHHQYPGAHWTTHPELYAKHKNEYVGAAKKQGSVFRHTHAFEIFFLIILRDYRKLAEKFVDMRSPEGQKIAGVSGGAGDAGWGGGDTDAH